MPDPITQIPTNPVPQDTEENISEELDQAAEATKQKLQQDPALAQSLGSTPDMQEAVIDIEKELLVEIMSNLDNNHISPEEAEKLAKEFLSYLPIQDQKDLLEKLARLSQKNKEAQGIYLKYAQPVEEDERQKKLTLMSEHLQQGNIEHALTVAKGGTPNA
jgi:CCR4-NOT transcriptional regulation complex NOT5 subunit